VYEKCKHLSLLTEEDYEELYPEEAKKLPKIYLNERERMD
jgi:hypothetical protein